MDLKRTSLYKEHKKLKARLVPFAGWEMPLQYTSIIEEHLAVRNHAGIFDVSHMGQIRVEGKNARNLLERITPNTVIDQKINQTKYNAFLNEKGGVKDDITIFKEAEDSYFIIVNASNTEKIYHYLLNETLKTNYVNISNQSNSYSMIALQGPSAEEYAFQVFPHQKSIIENLKYYHFYDFEFNYKAIRISRTGYTGEDGFEILGSHEIINQIWNECIQKNIKPCGLGARDSLRLEAMYPLYGHELNEERTPIESGIGWIVKEKPEDYYGKEKLLQQKKNQPDKIIIGFILLEGGIPRENYKVLDKNDKEIGIVQSGVYSPSLKKGIGTAFVDFFYKNPDTEIFINIRGKKTPATVIKPPFVKGTAGKKR